MEHKVTEKSYTRTAPTDGIYSFQRASQMVDMVSIVDNRVLKRFQSARAAAAYLQSAWNSIYDAVKGHRATALGFKWRKTSLAQEDEALPEYSREVVMSHRRMVNDAEGASWTNKSDSRPAGATTATGAIEDGILDEEDDGDDDDDDEDVEGGERDEGSDEGSDDGGNGDGHAKNFRDENGTKSLAGVSVTGGAALPAVAMAAAAPQIASSTTSGTTVKAVVGEAGESIVASSMGST
jgi:hypothetical protein